MGPSITAFGLLSRAHDYALVRPSARHHLFICLTVADAVVAIHAAELGFHGHQPVAAVVTLG